jgi:Tol biopolymer transport system component
MKQPRLLSITVICSVFASLLLITSACGDDDGSSGPGAGTTSPTSTAGATSRPIVTAPGNAVSPPPVVTGDGGGPEPSGTIAFYSFRDDYGNGPDQDIYTMNVDGSNQTNVSNFDADDYEPDWSPDGSRIAFSSAREGSPHIYVIDADGSNLEQLTTGAGGYLSPRWSPDGQSIALSRSGTIMVMNADGSDLRVVFNNQNEDVAEPCYGPGFPGGWSPDSQLITYYSASATRQTGEVCVVDVDTGEIEPVVVEPVAIHAEPVWSSDGRYLAYRSIRGGNSDVYVFDLEKGVEYRLTDDPQVDAEPEWSPDGEWIAFVSYREYPNSDIYIMRKDGSDVRRLTDDPAKDTYPVWTP